MDFFKLSKLFWFLVQPGNLIVLLLVTALLLERTRWRRGAHILVASVTVFLLAALVLPLDQWLARPLESRFAPATLPGCIDGILVLGGGEMPRITTNRDMPTTNDEGRYTAAVALLRQFPTARIVFSGGSSTLLVPDAAEAEPAQAIFAQLGVPATSITLEGDSRNTWENLVNSQRLVQPKPGETWVVVTSAIHMPRTIGIARALNWPLLPWPTDYKTTAAPTAPLLHWSLAQSLTIFDSAVREWIGLAVYRITGKSASWFPAPEPEPAQPSQTVCGPH
jgi:uncharacterized SAM-binding protein YcdF (DUF218 family)